MELLIAIVCLFIGYVLGRQAAARAVGRIDWDRDLQRQVIKQWGWTVTEPPQQQKPTA